MQEIVAAAPVMLDALDAESAAHFDDLKRLLDTAGVPYSVNPRLVRGLDYYNRTVFEWVTDALGSQGAVCSGGRYDGLVEKLGGRATPAVGALYQVCGGAAPDGAPDVYVVAVGEAALRCGLEVAEELRNDNPGLKLELNMGGGSFKSQIKRADKSGALLALVFGEAEVAGREAGVKPLRSDEDQTTVPIDTLAAELRARLNRD